MTDFSEFLEFLHEYFKGSTRRAEYREIFLCKGDPKSSEYRDRDVIWIGGLDTYFTTFIKGVKRLRKWNIYMGVGYLVEHTLLEPQLDKMLYDRLSFDFDNEEAPATAIAEAIAFATLLHREHGVRPLVFESGFKGAHVVVPLSKPVDWEVYQLLWRHFYDELSPAAKRMADLNMLQWNRVDKVPLTYNVKEEGARFVRIVYPRRFTWRDFNWDELQPLDPESVTVVKVTVPTVVKPKVLAKPSSRREWIRKVVDSGLPDGRKRFIFQVLVPYLVNVRRLGDEEIFKVCREFIENSCRNHDACEKIYDSWVRSVIKSAKGRGFKGLSLAKFKERNPDIKDLLEKILCE